MQKDTVRTATPPLALDDRDPRVVAARTAEAALFRSYGITATERYVTLPESGLRVRVSEIGSGDPVLVVPGNTGDVFPLASLLAELKGRRIIAVNRPGGGLSDGMDHRTVDIRQFAVSTLAAVLDDVGLETVPVVAHSIGAHWSLWLAMDRPARVSALVTLGNPGNVMAGNAPLLLRLMARPPLDQIVVRLLRPRSKRHALWALRFMGHRARAIAQLPAELAECYYAFPRLPHYRISATSLLANAAPRIGAAELARVRQPVLLLWGTDDTFAGVETGRAIAAALPKGRLQPIPEAGHLPWLDAPGECARPIRRFLRETGAP